ncbi:MAG: YhfC family intramembrane metalloprotease [Deltaproteobacteria bacterium]|nr:YhfC family intramembrane metalloprotease [Deltaproteobacteria bacterium]
MLPQSSAPALLVAAFAVSAFLVALLVFLTPRIWRARTGAASRYVWWGVATFFIFQIASRIPLVALLSKLAGLGPASGRAATLVAAVLLSYSAGFFEEVGRYIVLRRWCKPESGDAHAWRDAVAFGLGHGALEAFVLAALPYAGFAVLLSVRIDAPPPELAAAMGQILKTPAYMPFVSVVERAMALGLHAALAVMVARGINLGRSRVAVPAAIFVHGTVNLIALALMQAAGWWAAELAVAASVAGLLWWTVSVRTDFAFSQS